DRGQLLPPPGRRHARRRTARGRPRDGRRRRGDRVHGPAERVGCAVARRDPGRPGGAPRAVRRPRRSGGGMSATVPTLPAWAHWAAHAPRMAWSVGIEEEDVL